MCLDRDSDRWERTMADLVEAGRAIAAGATDPALHLRRGEAFWAVRDHARALVDLTAAIEGTPALPARRRAHALYRRSVCQHQLGRTTEAVADATASLELAPTPHARTARAIARYFAGDMTGALADADAALAGHPGEWEAQAFRGRARLELGDHAGAVADFTAVLATGQCRKYGSELLLQRAEARLALDDDGAAAAAEADATEAIDTAAHENAHWPFVVRRRAPRAHAAYLLRARARLRSGRAVLAAADCYLAATIAPEDPEVYTLRAQALTAAGATAEALLDLVRAHHLTAPASRTSGGASRTSGGASPASGTGPDHRVRRPAGAGSPR